ncbi:MAG: hypothetical protein HYU86_13005 [Chloroflexi bacterium]|nr:hypothetical protein [Chloroflexota bacterium]
MALDVPALKEIGCLTIVRCLAKEIIMRYFPLILALSLFVAGCASSSPPAAQGKTTAQPTSPPSSSAPGVFLKLDGKPIALEGESKSSAMKGSGVTTIFIDGGKNAGGSSRAGYGVRLELQSRPGGDLKEGFTAKDVAVATFTVYKDYDFWYLSSGAIPDQPIPKLTLTSTTGRLKGSYESNISGTAGKYQGAIEFDLPFPK